MRKCVGVLATCGVLVGPVLIVTSEASAERVFVFNFSSGDTYYVEFDPNEPDGTPTLSPGVSGDPGVGALERVYDVISGAGQSIVMSAYKADSGAGAVDARVDQMSFGGGALSWAGLVGLDTPRQPWSIARDPDADQMYVMFNQSSAVAGCEGVARTPVEDEILATACIYEIDEMGDVTPLRGLPAVGSPPADVYNWNNSTQYNQMVFYNGHLYVRAKATIDSVITWWI